MHRIILVAVGMLTPVFVSCSSPSQNQIVEAIQKDPKILADAIKKDPQAFKEAIQFAQEHLRKEHMKEQEELAAKEQEKRIDDPLKPELTSAQAYRGPASAPVLIVEYTDFECPYCSRGAESMKAVLQKYEGKVRVTLKHLPLPFHKMAKPAARYFEAVRLQSPEMAWKFHDKVFGNQGGLRDKGEDFLLATAKEVGADVAKLKKELKDSKIDKKIDADLKEAREFGFSGTPSFLVGGVPVRGALPPEAFGQVIERVLAKRKG